MFWVKRIYKMDQFSTIINIHSVELNLLDEQVEIILRGLELFGYNLEYMLNSTDSIDELKQEKTALLKYTYEQILASQAEQVDSKSNNISNLSNLGKILTKDLNNSEKNLKLYKTIGSRGMCYFYK